MTLDRDVERDLRERLHIVLDGASGPHPVWAASPAARTVAERAERDRRGRPAPILLVAAILLVGGAVVAGLALRQPPAPEPPAATNGWIAYSAGNDIYLAGEGIGGSPRRIVGGDADHVDQLCPAFSPDGTRLAYAEAAEPWFDGMTWTIVVVEVGAGGEPTGLAQRIALPEPLPGCPIWAPDGNHLAVMSEGAIQQLDLVGLDGARTTLFRRDDSGPGPSPYGSWQATMFEWAPDGSRIAVGMAYSKGVSELWLVPVAGGDARRVVAGLPDTEVFHGLAWSPDGSRLVFRGDVLTTMTDANGQEFTDVTGHFIRMVLLDQPGQPVVSIDARAAHSDDPLGAGPVAWSPDGGRLAFLRAGSLVVADLARHSELVLPDVHADGQVWPLRGLVWSPDGTRLAFLGADSPYLDRGVRSRLVSVDAAGAGPPVVLTPWRLAYYGPTGALSWQSVRR